MIRVNQNTWINLDRIIIIKVYEKCYSHKYEIRFCFDDGSIEYVGDYSTEEEAIQAAENILKEN